MGHFPSILKQVDDPDSISHIGGILSFLEPLCQKFPETESELIAWVSNQGWSPNEEFCAECSEIYKQGAAWQPPSARR